MDGYATLEEKQIYGYIVKQMFHTIFCLILKLFTPSVI